MRTQATRPGAVFAAASNAMTICGHRVVVDPTIQPLMQGALAALENAGREDLSEWVAERLRQQCGSARLLSAEPADGGIAVRFNPWVELALLDIRDTAGNLALSPREQRRRVRLAIHQAGL
jgi:hypothetical protein